jgi:hypothetical protein
MCRNGDISKYMNDIKKKKQEVIAKMKPILEEENRINKEYNRKLREEKINQIKCWWTYPWGHVETDWIMDDLGLYYRDCKVCNKRNRLGL